MLEEKKWNWFNDPILTNPLRPPHHHHTVRRTGSLKHLLQFVARHHPPVSFTENAQLPWFVWSMFLFSQVCDVPTSHKPVEGKRIKARNNDKLLLVVVLAELQPQGSSHCRWASWMHSEELQAGEQNILPCARLFPILLWPPAEFKRAKKKIKKLKIWEKNHSLPFQSPRGAVVQILR